MTRREPPQTEEGWYALHDLRRVDWDAWRNAPDRERERAREEGVAYLREHEAVADADAGDSAAFTVLGHKADLLVVHLRPTVAALDAAERRFERTALAEFTERASSYFSVTEASGYTERAREYFDGGVDEDSGLAQYIRSRLYPSIPDAGHVCFYPMNKRRDPGQNWYDLPFEERADHMASHGDIGRDYAGKVQQMITGSVGLDDWEWGVTLWADDPTEIKDLLYRMRFDPSTSKFAEFGTFYFGRRFPPEDLPALLAGDPVPTDTGTSTPASADASGDAAASASAGSAETGGPPRADADIAEDDPDEDLPAKLATLGLYPDEDYGTGDYGLVFYSRADASEIADDLDGLRGNFEHYDTHVLTTVRANEGRAAVVSVWETESAAETAAGFLNDLPGVVEGYHGPLGEGGNEGERGDSNDADEHREDGDIREELADLDVYAGQPHGEDVYAMVVYSAADPGELADEAADLRGGFDRYDTHVGTHVYESRGDGDVAVVSLWETREAAGRAGNYLAELPAVVGRAEDAVGGDAESGFGTMGMFYTVEPDHRGEFLGRFEEIGELLADTEGHHSTDLLVNREDENDMFIASRWRSREDAMDFFRSDAFSETVSWGREVLADRPRHVFLA